MNKNDAETYPDPHKIGAKRPSELKIGDAVKYHRVLPQREGRDAVASKIRSKPWQLGDGTWVIQIEAMVGCVSTQFLEPIE